MKKIFIILAAAAILIAIGCVEQARHKTVKMSDRYLINQNSDFLNNYLFYAYVWNLPPFGFVGYAPVPVRSYVMYASEDEVGWSVKSPEAMKAVQEPNGEITYEEEGFMEPQRPEGYLEQESFDGEPIDLEQSATEAQDSQATQVSEIPGDEMPASDPLGSE